MRNNRNILMISLQVTTFVCITASGAMTQNHVDLLRIDHGYGPQQNFRDTNVPATCNETTFDLCIPVVVNDSLAIVTGLLAERVMASVSPGKGSVSVFGMTLKLGLNKKHNDRWSGTYLVLPKLSSDLKRTGAQDVQIGGIALLKYKVNHHLAYKTGLYVNSDLFGPTVVPIAGVYWSGNRFEVNLTLPISVDIGCRIGKHQRVGALFSGVNKSYNLNQPRGKYLERSNNEAGLYLLWNFHHIHFQLLAGCSIGRKYAVYERTDRMDLSLSALKFGNTRNALNKSFPDGPVLKASVFYRLPTS